MQERVQNNNSSYLVVNNVNFSWPSGKQVIKNCSFSVPSPGLWMLVGRNGSGKSTLFRLITGMLLPQSGQITSCLKPALMFQNPDHQLLLPTCATDLSLSVPLDLDAIERKNRIKLVLDQVGLTGMESRPIHTLSGGQKQRLALAGALASNADLLLLDEPTALLDPSSQLRILELVKKLSARKIHPITAIWVTHRLQELEYSDGAAIMKNGQVGSWKSGPMLKKSLRPLARLTS